MELTILSTLSSGLRMVIFFFFYARDFSESPVERESDQLDECFFFLAKTRLDGEACT